MLLPSAVVPSPDKLLLMPSLLLPVLPVLPVLAVLFMPNAPSPHPDASQPEPTEGFSFSKSGQIPLAESKSAVIYNYAVIRCQR